MRSVIVIEVFPRLQLRIEIHVIRVRQQLIKLGLIRSVGAFDFAIQLRGLRFDVHMPVKTSLKLMPPVGSNRADPEGKFFDNIVHELDRTLLGMFREDL